MYSVQDNIVSVGVSAHSSDSCLFNQSPCGWHSRVKRLEIEFCLTGENGAKLIDHYPGADPGNEG